MGVFKGFIGFDDCESVRADWDGDTQEVLRLRFVAGLLSMYLMKERSMERLEKMQRRIVEEETGKVIATAEENLSLINDIIGSGMWYFDFNEQGERIRVSWSDTFRHMLGFENERDFPNTFEAWADRLHPDDREETLKRYAQGISGEREYNVKYRVKKKNGKYEWFNAHGKCGLYPNGKPRIFVGTFINITLAENESRDVNGKMAAILGGIRGGLKISTTADAYPYTYISDEVAAIQGYRVDEMMRVTNGNALDNVIAEDRGMTDATVRRQLELGDEHSVKYRVRHRDGSIRWVHDFGRRVLMPDSTELIYSLIQDITQEQTFNIRLAAEQAQYRNALMQNAKSSFAIDVTEGILKEERVELNDGYFIKRLNISLPCSIDEFFERYKSELKLEFLNENTERLFSRDGLLEAYNGGAASEYVEYYKKIDDTYMRAQILLARDALTEHIFATMIIFDITQSKKNELEKQRMLKEALLQAEHANRAKTTFLNNMSHDIRTPMNAIIGFTALAMSHIDDKEKTAEYLKKIETSSSHLLSLINDVLDMSRIESGKVKIDESEISLPNVLHDIKSIVQADIHAKQMKLFFNTVDVTDENVWCDKLRLNQILLNCISNAIKFTPAGGTVDVSVVQLPCEEEGFASYDFHIKDNGIGMSKEFVKHIFEPFERERTSTVSGIEGTGLGMPITKNIVDMMGGTITVKSEKGKGSEFVISLRLKLTGETEKDYLLPSLKGVHALVADDSYATCTSVAAMLRKLGLRPEWTMSGKEAVLRSQDARENHDAFGVYIIDWLMPDMNGIEVVRRLRAEIDEKTPIIILTAYDWADIEEEAKKAGVTRFISKPIFISELRSLLSADNTVSEIHSENSENTSALAGLKVLLVEDNDMNREIAQEILTEMGAAVDTAENGLVAVDKVKNNAADTYDVILMDVQMPIMNGYEATKCIRAISPEYSRIPIIAMTANAFEEDKKASLDVGMNGYIAKPIQINSIINTIKSTLQ